MATHEEHLRRLALHDEHCIQSLLGIRLSDAKAAGLDPKAQALVRLAALIAAAPITGLARLVAATPAVARSVGYDIDWAFKAFDSDPSH